MVTQVTTQAFRRGMSWGRKGIFRGDLCVQQSEEGIVEIIENLSHPEVFTMLVGEN